MRTLREEPWFAAVAERFFGSTERSDARLEAVKWALAHDRDLSRYPAIRPTQAGILRALPTQPLGAFPAVTVYFTVSEDDQCVSLQDLYMRPSPGSVPMPLRPMVPGSKAPVRPLKR